MINAKQIADFVTLFRGMLGFGLVWLGLTKGDEGLQTTVFIMLVAWTGDVIDGRIARRSRKKYQSWIGIHDLEIDMAVSCGLLVYLVTAGFLNIWLASIYILLWTFIFWRWKNIRVLGMLSQAPIYAYFILISLVELPNAGVWILAWIVIAVIITWPQFPKVIVPGFIDGMREFLINYRNLDNDK